MTRILRLETANPLKWANALRGRYLDHRHYKTIIGGESVDVLKPDGSPLILLRHRALTQVACARALPTFQTVGSRFSGKRGYHSGIMGSYDKPVCRKVEFHAPEVNRWKSCMPFVREANDVFRRELPERFENQRSAADAILSEWLFEGTCFTTLTANRWNSFQYDGRTSVHRDKGDLPEGFGVIHAFSVGDYQGAYLIFPRWEIAVDLRTTDLLLADVHELHGNGPADFGSRAERVATILYFLTAMRNCGKTSQTNSL
jgi:hypothetical protein